MDFINFVKTGNMKKIFNRITTDDRICNGKPIIRGKRITVQTILEYLSSGDKPEDILKQYPSLEMADIKACLKFAASLMGNSYSVTTVA
jgi:uncharacterized protein (DUF433 family)